jgi:putative endonuclease
VTTAVAVVIPNEERDLSHFVLREKSVLSVKSYYVYVLTNWNQRVMYVGVTSDLKRRIHEHQNKLVKGFTEKYNVNKLVYYEQTNDVITALAREKEIKKWRRQKKDNLVVSVNPQWQDLSAYF